MFGIKKISFILIFMVLVTFLISCSSENTSAKTDIDEIILEQVRTVEILNHKLNQFYISYDEYTIGLKGLFIEDVLYERIYTIQAPGFDLKDFTDEQREKIRESFMKEGNNYEIQCEISDVYTEEERERKYVFTKSTFTRKNQDYQNYKEYMVRKYHFHKSNDEWLIAYIEDALYSDMEIPESDVVKIIPVPYTQFNNEEVQYIERFNPFE